MARVALGDLKANISFFLQVLKHRAIFRSLHFAFSMQSATESYAFVKYILQPPFPSVSIVLA